MLCYALRILNCRGKTEQSLSMLTDYLDHVKKNQRFVFRKNIVAFILAVESFCNSIEQKKLVQLLEQLRDKFGSESQHWLNSYLLFQLFTACASQFNESRCLWEIKQVLRVIETISYQCALVIKPQILHLVNTF